MVPHGDKATGASGSGLRPARHGRRSRRRGLGRALERPARELRPPQVQGPAERSEGAEGYMCHEGWTFYAVPGPKYKGDVDAATADSNYYNWSDKFNSLGLGENVQIATSNQGGALLALVNGKWVVLRVPYPLGYYNKSINGRIDDPAAGWKGRGLWTGWGNRNPWHNEGDKRRRARRAHADAAESARALALAEVRTSKSQTSSVSNRRGSERIAPTPICLWPSRAGTIRMKFASISLKGIFMHQLHSSTLGARRSPVPSLFLTGALVARQAATRRRSGGRQDQESGGVHAGVDRGRQENLHRVWLRNVPRRQR